MGRPICLGDPANGSKGSIGSMSGTVAPIAPKRHASRLSRSKRRLGPLAEIWQRSDPEMAAGGVMLETIGLRLDFGEVYRWVDPGGA